MGKASRRHIRSAGRQIQPAKSFDPRDVMINEQSKSLSILASMLKKQHDEITLLLDQLGEVNLRVRFIMEMFKYEKASPVVGFDGRPVTAEVRSLHELYLHSRERFLAVLTKETDDGTLTGSHDTAEGTQEDRRSHDTDNADTADAEAPRHGLTLVS